MADMSTALSVVDKMSSPMQGIISTAQKTVNVLGAVNSAASRGFDPSNIIAANINIVQVNAGFQKVENTINNAADAQSDLNDEIQKGANFLNKLGDKVVGCVSSYASFDNVKKVLDLSDQITQTKSKLELMNDGMQSTKELQDKIFASAQRSRSAYMSTADVVAKLGQNGGEAFGSNDETIAFVENLNKMFVIAGASQEEITSASSRLAEALGSGVLSGEELNAVYATAPNIIQTIADYMNVPVEKIREMASEGQLTSGIVKNAMLGATDDINAQFEQTPMTWGQVWTGICNKILNVTQPLLNLINLLAQNWSVIEPIVLGLVTVFGLYAAALIIANGIETISNVLKAISVAHSKLKAGATLAEAAATKTAGGAQLGMNAALLACPIFWIIAAVIAFIAIIYVVIAVINKVTGTTTSATGVILGALAAAGAFIWNLFLSILDIVLAVINDAVNLWVEFANFFANLFNDPVAAIIHLFADMADRTLDILKSIASAIDKVFGTNLADKVSEWQGSLASQTDVIANKYGNGSYQKKFNKINLTSESLGLKRIDYSNAYKAGYSAGEKIDGKIKGLKDAFSAASGDDLADLASLADTTASNTGNTATNTGKVADAVTASAEDLKYIRDIAEQEAINRFTTAQITVNMTNNNSVNRDTDIDGITEHLRTRLEEEMNAVAEGVY